MLVDFVLWIVLGALAGWIASMIMGTNAQMGALSNIVVGVVGAFIGGLLCGCSPACKRKDLTCLACSSLS